MELFSAKEKKESAPGLRGARGGKSSIKKKKKQPLTMRDSKGGGGKELILTGKPTRAEERRQSPLRKLGTEKGKGSSLPEKLCCEL